MSGRSGWGPGLVLVSLGVLVVGCEPEESPPILGEVLPEGVDYAFTQMRTFMTREGIRRARLEADTAEFVGETEVHMRPVTLIFFDQDGRESTVITADYGVYYELTEDMDAEGSVVVLDRADGQRLETERMKYVNAEDRLYGDTAFTFYRDDGRTIIEGSAFESDPGMDSLVAFTPSGQTARPVVRAPASAPVLGAEEPAADSASGVETDSVAAVEPTFGDSAAVDTVAVPPDSIGTSLEPPDSTGAPSDTVADAPRVGRPQVPR